ncbi:acylneuraminate cytidylyltransferase family protein [Enterococcus hulanensis]|uniref:acylneuraminate cytidylyltransferase family protein n=1 Tax=Enterococcus hulanensis TaxID=2559929 RepID=UPI002890B282|nr:acylneuraminate cytidylyltransferase family protein [Enterococcus hulanensis]MDT2660866.1 acylneuraminate cytidylyltransferase family protein [Enterococcus hulanensis]
MNILFTICGRAGSKGFKNKNLKTLYHKPLVGYALSLIKIFSKRNPEININVALNTDSTELQNLVSELMPSVINIERKAELANGTVGKIMVIRDTFIQMESITGCIYDKVIDLDITSPLRTIKDLESLYNKGIESDLDVIFSVVASRRNPYFNMVQVKNDEVSLVNQSTFTSRQQAPLIYDMNASMYLFNPTFLMHTDYLFDGHCGIIEMKDYLILDIDSEEDFLWLEHLVPFIMDNDKGIEEVYQGI